MIIKTGLTMHEFNEIFASIPSLMQKIKNVGKAKDALFMYLTKLRTGESNINIGIEFNCSRQKVKNV